MSPSPPSFDQLGIHPHLLKSLHKLGFKEPTPIQYKAIPKALKGHDLRASADTGTGKTAAFLLPMIQRMMLNKGNRQSARGLILLPTRELAQQVLRACQSYLPRSSKIGTVLLCGGMPYPPQLRQLKAPHDILIATPGRIVDLINKKKISLKSIEMVVLDEADRMLDMGFIEPVEFLLSKTPASRQTLLFSATFNPEVCAFSERLLSKPLEIIIPPAHKESGKISHSLHYVDHRSHKEEILDHLLKQPTTDRSIVFTATKRQADELTQSLRAGEHRATALHGDMNQRQRTSAIGKLHKGSVSVLVATDVAARGIDIPALTHVINFDIPQQGDDYIHRTGRVGRAGATGNAHTFATYREEHIVRNIEKALDQPLTASAFPGLEPSPRKASPKKGGKKRSSFPLAIKKKSRVWKRKRT
ncbi:MAG: DEAD/DEAH box helicase [Chlamydiota bacterium]|nr:DEAD/DEAH box helicase [Chlamydiota bacterium]